MMSYAMIVYFCTKLHGFAKYFAALSRQTGQVTDCKQYFGVWITGITQYVLSWLLAPNMCLPLLVSGGGNEERERRLCPEQTIVARCHWPLYHHLSCLLSAAMMGDHGMLLT